jgi:bacterioferritin-associated ferredoxin
LSPREHLDNPDVDSKNQNHKTEHTPVIVCSCRALTERDIEDAIAAGATTIEAIGLLNGAGTDCGCCQEDIASRVARGCGRDCATCPNRAANEPGPLRVLAAAIV